jgi:hypothetical protein
LLPLRDKRESCMTKEHKKLTVTILVFLIFGSICYTSTLPKAIASEIGNYCNQQDLGSLVGIDTTKYATSIALSNNDSYKNALPATNVRYTLDSSESKIDTYITYVNNSITMIEIFSNQGSPHLTTTTNNITDQAQNFLTTYQAQTKNSLYGQLNAMIPKDLSNNYSTTLGNINLTITASSDKDTTLRWTYQNNGVSAPDKCVALRYQNGYLKYFVNNWDLYKVGSTEINLSEQEAIDIAMDAARKYSPDSKENGTIGGIKFNVTNAMVVEKILSPSVYVDADNARSQDMLELYPMYSVWVSLDKFYPGNVYGFNVYVWADTKQVCYIHQRVSDIDPSSELVAASSDNTSSSQSNQTSPITTTDNQTALTTTTASNFSSLFDCAWVIFPVCCGALLMGCSFYVRGRKSRGSFIGFQNVFRLKFNGLLLCCLILLPLFIVAFSTYGDNVKYSLYCNIAPYPPT